MAALMSILTIAVPTLAATDLKDYPTFLLTADKALDAYVVVGSAAQTSDVVGAIDLATALAQAAMATTTSSITGAAQAVDGTERKIVIPGASTAGVIGGSGSNNLPANLFTYHYSGLKQAQYEYKGTKHNYKEMVVLGTSTPQLTHKLADPVNGTLKMKIDTNAFVYKYQFVDSIADFGIATSANSTTYQNPIKVTVAGKDLSIVAIPSTASFRALTGSVGWITQGSSGLTVGDLSLQVGTVYSGTGTDIKASVTVVDSAGNLVKDLGVLDTSTQTFTYGGSSYSVKLLNTATVTVAGTGTSSAQLAFAKGDVDKLYDGSDTATVSDWGSDWKVSGQFGTQGVITANDNITVTYSPSSLAEANKYYTAGSTFKGPGGYFELAYVGYEPSKFAKITIEPVTGKTVYNVTTATGYSTKSSLNGLKLSTDVSGSIVSGSTGYDEVYVLFNETPGANFANIAVWTGYWDKATSRIVQFTATPATTGILASTYTAGSALNYTLSYGGPGATATYVLSFNMNATSTGLPFNDIDVYNSTYDSQVDINFNNRTSATAGGSVEFILGTGASTADTSDVTALVEGTLQDVSSQPKDLITDNGVQVYTVKDNTVANKVIVGIPPEQIYGKVQFGKVTAGTSSTSYTTQSVVRITTAVAKLDSEVTATEKAKNLVLVGGPCVNTLVADLATAGKFDYTCANWPAENFALIKVVDGAFTTGKVALVVAGTRADDSRLGTSVLQQYDQAAVSGKLIGTAVKITGTAVSTATIAAA